MLSGVKQAGPNLWLIGVDNRWVLARWGAQIPMLQCLRSRSWRVSKLEALSGTIEAFLYLLRYLMAHLLSDRYLTSNTLSSSKLIKPPFHWGRVIVLKPTYSTKEI